MKSPAPTTPTSPADPTGTGTAAVTAAGLAADLSVDLTAGRWTPTHLDRRLAQLLVTASAGDGQLTPERLRTALWEGGEPFLRQPDNRFAQLLTHLTGTPPAPRDTTVPTLLHRLAR
ncbi:hypothetical protein AB0G79_27090 [Streptomyces sp. NPDC020807]|uniref:hypothetical protein n=1 Tax=Streptomyces sp. NPDC020807 TaxID=3155119 RepID=UPI0033D11E14